MPNNIRQDPRWKEISASLREGKLFVKLPHFKALLLRDSLLKTIHLLSNDEYKELAKTKDYLEKYSVWLTEEMDMAFVARQPSVFYRAILTVAAADAEHLGKVVHLDPTGRLSEFHAVLEAGLRNDPEVDWIARVSGPSPDFSGLERGDYLEMSTVDLEDFAPLLD